MEISGYIQRTCP